MKYKYIAKETARETCKQQKKNCNTCPLRRENGNGRVAICYYILEQLYEEMDKYSKQQLKELKNENVKYWKEN